MDPAHLIPTPDALQVHWLIVQLPLTLTTFLHLVAMNVVIGTACLCLILFARKNDTSSATAKNLAGILPVAMAAAINLGVPPLLFLQTLYGQFLYTSTVLMAFFWLAIVDLLIFSYYALYLFLFRRNSAWGSGPLLLAGALAALALVSLFFTNNNSIMQQPTSWLQSFPRINGLQLNFSDPAMLPRYLHFMLSALAVGGLTAAAFDSFRHRRGDSKPGPLAVHGCTIFASATIANFGIGFWFLGAVLPTINQAGGLITGLFALALFGSVISAAVSVIRALTGRIIAACGWSLAAIFLMTVDRDLLRLATLAPYWSPNELPVAPQYSPFFVFLLFAVGAVFLIRWMLAKALKNTEVTS